MASAADQRVWRVDRTPLHAGSGGPSPLEGLLNRLEAEDHQIHYLTVLPTGEAVVVSHQTRTVTTSDYTHIPTERVRRA